MISNPDRDPSSSAINASFRNHFLASVPRPVLEKLEAQLIRVDLPAGTMLLHSDREIQWLYFLERGMASVSSLDRAGAPVEVGVIGREGIVGFQSLLGQPLTHTSAIMQGSGEGYRLRADALREYTPQDADVTRLLHTFLHALLEQTTQLVLCNRLHELEARLARWLLTACDFMGTRAIHLTQEFLAEMLGVGRPAVTLAAGVLQRNGYISYSRGLVEVADPAKLEQVTCDCYGIIRNSYKRLYPTLY
ncbi:Crp/Fnr family transcriptional regulator [Acidipila sp. EB88]|uniref:Crp/Fnr family transcriptional regulator n=1 Tax=Acidipila sp. EB88 TaxID=2305226 RepID=UPI0013152402|nr:Crp/Fnr family transcriptional regulator [Acidipila sp. EB88]